MKKIFVVLALGGALLALFLWVQRRSEAQAITPDPQGGAAVAASTAAKATAMAPATTAPAAASAPVATSDKAACARLADLCSTSDQKVDVEECEKQMADARKMSGAANVERSEQCLGDAKTCAAASGCISGGVGMGAMGEFLKGLGSAMSH